MHELTTLANKYDLDKGTKFAEAHGYTELYGPIFEQVKDKPIKLLEIGVWHGDSLRLWEEYFPNAQIYGIDIDPECKRYATDRSRVIICDQRDIEALKVIGDTEGPFDIIIDDGSHEDGDIIISFHTLYPYLNKGGVYFIEDLHAAPIARMAFEYNPLVGYSKDRKLALIEWTHLQSRQP